MRIVRLATTLTLATALATTLVACTVRPALTFSPEALPDGAVGQPYSVAISIGANQTPVGDIYAEGALPPGLALPFDRNAPSSTATLSGTPTEAGTYQLTISAWCLGTNVSGQTGSHQYTIVVR